MEQSSVGFSVTAAEISAPKTSSWRFWHGHFPLAATKSQFWQKDTNLSWVHPKKAFINISGKALLLLISSPRALGLDFQLWSLIAESVQELTSSWSPWKPNSLQNYGLVRAVCCSCGTNGGQHSLCSACRAVGATRAPALPAAQPGSPHRCQLFDDLQPKSFCQGSGLRKCRRRYKKERENIKEILPRTDVEGACFCQRFSSVFPL